MPDDQEYALDETPVHFRGSDYVLRKGGKLSLVACPRAILDTIEYLKSK